MCCDSWGRKELDMTEQLNGTNFKLQSIFCIYAVLEVTQLELLIMIFCLFCFIVFVCSPLQPPDGEFSHIGCCTASLANKG